MSIKKETLEKMNVRASVGALVNLVISYRRMVLGDVPASAEMCSLTRDSIKELCANVSAWADWYYGFFEGTSSEDEPSKSAD